jgi:hypothetical protein
MTNLAICRLIASIIGFFIVVGNAFSDEPKLSIKAEPGWEEVAKEQKLSETQIAMLRKQKFVVRDQSMRQIFSAYIGGGLPVFVTSDSILNGYHVLLEESIFRLEEVHARKLPAVLERTTKNLDKAAEGFKVEPALIADAQKRAGIFLWVARNLLDENVLPDAASWRLAVREEVKRVVAATETCKPDWLGPPDEGFIALDYTRFKPRGFYTKSDSLKRYFRAIAWLQAIPFRLEKDQEILAFAFMRQAYFEPNPDENGASKKPEPDYNLWTAFRKFLGNGDDWDLSNAYELPRELAKGSFDQIRARYRERAEKEQRVRINDQLRFSPVNSRGRADLAFRFFAPYQLPDGAMFARTTSLEGINRDFPSGLELAAMLGSPMARNELAKESPRLLAEIDGTRSVFRGRNLYADYLRCLGALLERTEPDAPAFMNSNEWKTKTCQTALAGWAQMRHTWALQAKVEANYLCASRQNAGFVEPVPEFYGKLAKLIDDTRDALDNAGALTIDPKALLKEKEEEFRAALVLVKKAQETKRALRTFTHEERDLLSKFDPQLEDQWDLPEEKRESEKTLADLERVLGYYQSLFDAQPDDRIWSALGYSFHNLDVDWNQLSKLCHRLEVLAHKQLRQIPFNDDENKFLEVYGIRLAGVMFYGGNSYVTPRDDAMRVVDVYSNPRVGSYLNIGIARPRLMWVLYPTKEGEKLCLGGVMPYAEFTHFGRLTDAEWKSLLSSPNHPDPPAWARTVIPPERSREAKK